MKPTMKLETAVTHIHTLLPGETVGYGGTYRSDTPRTLATLPVGYADGWLRAFSGCEITLHTKEGDVTAPIVGRICMDQCMVDVTDLPVAVGTPVTLFGETSAQLESLADRAHTIPYELLCLITARIPRVWGNDSKKERP
jgi:alanine racemase